MVKQQSISRLSSLLIIFLPLNVFSAPCLNSKNLMKPECRQPSHSHKNDYDLEPTFIAYRLAVRGSSERKCRFEPTCSRFLIEASKQYGLPKGIIFSFARAQMSHDNLFGTLKATVNNDNFMIVKDSIFNW